MLERRPAETGLSPSQAPCSKGLGLPPALTGLLQTTTPLKDFQSELFPLHSPLLRESWLVSFPPLINMLKFSGYSCLIGGPIWSYEIGLFVLLPRPPQNHKARAADDECAV